ncbi:cell death protein hid [Aedes aegypti]|uniref:Uncharacterized protein n=1 Tax=Aedes aegypti TaxID=7159 RepID=A0A6I8TLN6_AEDAE|nr:cell death protein hid [Aedes aegypti]
MAIPFLQPEEDESARHGNGQLVHAGAGAGAGSSAASGSAGSSSGVVGAGSGIAASGGGAVMMVGATGPLPIPNSPAPISSGTSTAVQTPLIGPMNSDQLVQLFYEALYRYSRGDTPSTPISQSPQSSSCSPFTTGYYNSGGGGGSAGFVNTGTTSQVFFPQTPNGVYRPSGVGSFGTTGVFFGQPPTPSPSGSSSHSSQHSANSPETPACSSAPPIFHQFPSSYQLPSTANASTTTNWSHHGGPSGHDGDESSESDSSQPSSISEGDTIAAPIAACSPHCLGLLPGAHHHLLDAGSSTSTSTIGANSSSSGSSSTMATMSGYIPPHLDYMAGREQLQEFAGKIPQRKKKSSSSSKSSSKSKKSKFLEQTLVWPTLAVTATLIALGCGLLAAR